MRPERQQRYQLYTVLHLAEPIKHTCSLLVSDIILHFIAGGMCMNVCRGLMKIICTEHVSVIYLSQKALKQPELQNNVTVVNPCGSVFMRN